MRVWCEHCRLHFDVDHYDDDDNHKVGPEWGWVGYDMACRVFTEKMRELATEQRMADILAMLPDEPAAVKDPTL